MMKPQQGFSGRRLITAIAVIFILVAVNFLILSAHWQELGYPQSVIPFFPDTTNQFYVQAISNHIHKNLAEIHFHVWLSIGFAIVGILQISDSVRKKFRRFHQINGIFYFAMGLIVTLTGARLGMSSLGAPYSSFIFFAIAVFWLYFSGLSIRCLFKRNYRDHAIYAKKSFVFALTPLFSRPPIPVVMFLIPEIDLRILFPIAMTLAFLVSWFICQKISLSTHRGKAR